MRSVRVWLVLMLTAGASAQQPAPSPAENGPADRAAPRQAASRRADHRGDRARRQADLPWAPGSSRTDWFGAASHGRSQCRPPRAV